MDGFQRVFRNVLQFRNQAATDDHREREAKQNNGISRFVVKGGIGDLPAIGDRPLYRGTYLL